MGEGSLELIRRIEEEFSIYLPEHELNGVYTVGNLYNVLLRLLKPTPDCLTSKAFYRIRRALVAALGVRRNSIRPATFLDDLFDQKHIREQWGDVANESEFELPRLRHSAMWKHWMRLASALFSFAIAIGTFKLLSHFQFITLENSLVFFAFYLYGFVLWGILYVVSLKATPFRRSVLPTLSVGELARVALSMNSAEFANGTDRASNLTEDQVWMRLVSVLCDQMSFQREDVVPSASFSVDLGFD